MGNKLLWATYENLPENSINLIGKTFKHDVHDVEVVILECHPLVHFITGKIVEEINKNLPSVTIPGFVVRLVNEELTGRVYMIRSDDFFVRFYRESSTLSTVKTLPLW